MKNKYIMHFALFLILIPIILLFSCIEVDMYLFIIMYSFLFMYFINYLFIKNIKSKKSMVLIIYGFVFQFMMIVWIYSNAVSLGSVDHPLLVLDRQLYHTIAVNFAQSSTPMDVLYKSGINYIGYPLVLGIFYKLFFPNLIVGLMLSVSVGIFNAYMAARIAKLITNNNLVVFYTVLFFLISPQMNSASTALLKDIFIISAFLMIILAFLLYQRTYIKSALTYFVMGFIILALFRLAMLPLIMGIAFFITSKKFALKQILLLVIIVIVSILAFSYTAQFAKTAYVSNGLSGILDTTKGFTEHMTFHSSSFTERLVAGYDQWPLIKRILFIPVFTIVQYLTPFNFWTVDFANPANLIKLNMQTIWFFFLGPLTLFSLMNYKNINNLIIKKMLLFGGFGYILIAFMNGGTLPRYAYPFYAILIIVVAYMYAQTKENTFFKKKFHNFYSLYLLGVALMGVFYFAIKLK